MTKAVFGATASAMTPPAKAGLCVRVPRTPPSRHVYLDASNIWIAGAQVSAARLGAARSAANAADERIFDHRLRVNFRSLREFLVGQCRADEVRALCVGSTNSNTQSTPWLHAQQAGWATYTPQRSVSGHEKEVDTFLSVAMMEDLFGVDPGGTEITICSGDRDLVPVVEALLRRGHKVDVASWEHSTAVEMKRIARRFISLDDYFQFVTFRSTTH